MNNPFNALTIFICVVAFILLELITDAQEIILNYNVFIGLIFSALLILSIFYTNYYLYKKYEPSIEHKDKEV